ncbi:hypothetical protein GW916_01835 [bacterium]|nr:hypothetical protein [bacterium]
MSNQSNKVKVTLIFLSTLFVSSASFAALNSTIKEGEKESTLSQVSFSSPFLLNQVYVSKQSGAIQVEEASDDSGEVMAELSGQFLDIPVGSSLSIIERSEDGRFLTLSLDLEGLMADGVDVSELPNLMKVSASELLKLNPSIVEVTSFEDGFGHFVVPEELAAKKKGGRAKMTYCLADVRIFASSKNCRAKIARVKFARQGYQAYLNTGGWKKISKKNWKDYPVCTACFYSGGRQDCKGGCGHTAIKINSNLWKGAGIRSVPGLPNRNGVVRGVLRRPYKFLGCVVPKHI